MLKAEWSIKLLESLILDSARHGRFTRRIQIWSKADLKQVFSDLIDLIKLYRIINFLKTKQL